MTKKIKSALFYAVLLATSISMAGSPHSVAAAPLGPTQAGLVGAWDFEDGAGSSLVRDAVNSNHAVLTDMDIHAAWTPGKVGAALSFDGVNDQAIISSIAQLHGAQEMTISMWVKSAGDNEGWEGLFNHRAAGSAVQTGLTTPNTVPNVLGDVQGRINGTGSIVTTPGGAVVDGEWVHLVQTYKNGEFHRIYVNGQLAVQGAGGAGTIISEAAWRFGNDIASGGRFFNGQIDDVALWNRALSPGDIHTIWGAAQHGFSVQTAGNAAHAQGLLAHWTFDDHAGGAAVGDRVGGHHASLTNTAVAASGQIGGALAFNGATMATTALGSGVGNGADALTLSIWVNPSAKNNWAGFLTSTGADFFGLQMDAADAETNGQNFHFRVKNTGLYTDIDVPLNEWSHVVGVWESGNIFAIYVNGEFVASAAAPAGVVNVNQWVLGRDRAIELDGGRYFQGLLDDAGLWERALSAEEIALIYETGLAGFNLAVQTPEPSAWAMLVLGGLGIGVVARRRFSK